MSDGGEEDRCLVCLNRMEVFSVGECNHPVCHICSTRMRVLCLRNECAICRRDLPKVIFTMGESKFEHVKDNIYPMDRKFKVCFETEEIQNQYTMMLDHKCPLCEEKTLFKSFRQLDQHIRREHEVYYCELCVGNLKLFTHERKTYTRKQLVEHRRKGDPDDTSFKGHPLCEFCDQRFIDDEELYKHLRKDHYFCHFCDADGLQHFYSEYNDLRGHFASDHYLCEEPNCEEKKFVVFRTEIDLKGHRLDQHGGALSKAASKEARKVELEFQYSRREPQGREDRGRGGRDHRGQGRSATPEVPYHDQLDGPVRESSEAVPDLQADFPSLFAAAPSQPRGGEGGRRGQAHRPGQDSGTQAAGWSNSRAAPAPEDFPSLPGAPRPAPASAPAPYRPRAPAPRPTSQPQKQGEAFPGLGPPAKRPTAWQGPVRAQPQPRNTKVAPAPVLPARGGRAGKQKTGQQSLQGGMRVLDRRISDSEDDSPVQAQPDLGLNCHFSKLAVKNSGQDLNFSLSSEASSTIQTVDRAQFEARQAAVNRASASANSKADLAAGNFPGLGAPERKLEFPLASNKKKSKNNKKTSNNNDSLTSSRMRARDPAPAPGLSSICDFLGGSDRKTEDWQEVREVKKEAKKEVVKKPETKSDIRPIVGHSKHVINAEDVFRPSKAKKTSPEEDVKENKKPLKQGNVDDSENFPDLGGTKKSLGAHFVKAEDKIFKPKVAPSQWSQSTPPEVTARASNGKETSNGAPRAPPPGFSKDFPTLGGGGAGPARKAPPGFSRPPSTSSSSSAPPGFAVKNRSNHAYAPPANFQARNSGLITTITGLVGGKSLEFKTFKEISVQFRKGKLHPDSYYSQCRALVTSSDFDTFFPELLALLPDLRMQGELLALYVGEEGRAAELLTQCETCGQVCLAGEESREHRGTHGLDQDFPRL